MFYILENKTNKEKIVYAYEEQIPNPNMEQGTYND